MRWATLSYVHLDRVAAPWLIRRFVDPDAEFVFVDWPADGSFPDARLKNNVPAGATPIGIPGVVMGLHDETGSCFSKVLRHYGLDDPALWRMERALSVGISKALGTPGPPEPTDEEEALGTSLNLLGTALGLLFDDGDHIDNALVLYDALYELCRMRELPADIIAATPPWPPQKMPYLREALARD